MTSKLEEAAKIAYEVHRKRMEGLSNLPAWEELDESWHKGYVRNCKELLQALKDLPEELDQAVCESDLDIYWNYKATEPGSPSDAWNFIIDRICSNA